MEDDEDQLFLVADSISVQLAGAKRVSDSMAPQNLTLPTQIKTKGCDDDELDDLVHPLWSPGLVDWFVCSPHRWSLTILVSSLPSKLVP